MLLVKLAIRATRIERRLQLNEIAQLHIPVINWQVSPPLFPLVRNALAHFTRTTGFVGNTGSAYASSESFVFVS